MTHPKASHKNSTVKHSSAAQIMNSTVPTSTLEWIQAKYGIAILFAGLLAMAMDHSHAKCYLQGPVTGGLLIALLALLSKKLVRYHYTPLQFNSGIFLFMLFWSGFWLAANSFNLQGGRGFPLGFMFCAFPVCSLSYLAIFFTSCTYQDEMEEMDKQHERHLND